MAIILASGPLNWGQLAEFDKLLQALIISMKSPITKVIPDTRLLVSFITNDDNMDNPATI
jgi:hypothetical protein